MKTCKHCHQENSDEAKFCSYCGMPFEEEDITLEEAAQNAVDHKDELNTPQEENDKLNAQNTVQDDSDAEDVPDMDFEEEQWYFVRNKQTMGPYSIGQMIDMIKDESIGAYTYVWKQGMESWERLTSTSLKAYLPQKDNWEEPFQNSYQNQPQDNYSYSTQHYRAMITSKSVILYLILYVVTCGLFELFWLYSLANDINSILESNGKRAMTSAGMTVLLDIVTCGLYKIYFFWKAGKSLYLCDYPNGYRVTDNSTVLTVLALLCPIVAFAILQDVLNGIVDNDRIA